MPKVVSLILAGGQGARLYPLTKVRSKPAVPIAGRFRLIDIPISNCLHSGLKKIYVLTQFATVSLHRHIFLTYRFDNFTKDFVTILSAQQTLRGREWYQGTADAVRQNLGHFHDQGDLALVLSGDHLYRMDYRKFIDFHLSKKADLTVSVMPVPADRAPDFGVMKVGRDGRITEFVEKPKEEPEIRRLAVDEENLREFQIEPQGRTHMASMGIYVFNMKALEDVLREDSGEDFGRQVIPHSIAKRKVYAYFFDGYWEDIGTIPSFFRANIDLTQPLPRFNFYDEDKPIFTHARFLPGSKILDSQVSHSILCEGSIINSSSIRNSIVGVRSRIGERCTLERTVLMGADYFESREQLERVREAGLPPIGLGEDCEIRDAIIDKNARIGKGVRLVNARNVAEESAENYEIVDGILVVHKNAVIADGTAI
ncbi:MAG: glucose-1-phosphate adenylyltransferase [Candidatus Aminicenantes bacterium]|nr:glucose-1-phosphate adenylyltransferase [Candidatus Aminicenantes bacterium]